MFITLYRIDARGEAHYYTLHDRQIQLFSEHSFTASWGTNLSPGREKVHVFGSRPAMDRKIREIINEKLKQGYKVLYSYFTQNETQATPSLKKYAAG